jgi:hypothetical protein
MLHRLVVHRFIDSLKRFDFVGVVFELGGHRVVDVSRGNLPVAAVSPVVCADVAFLEITQSTTRTQAHKFVAGLSGDLVAGIGIDATVG